MSDGIRDRRLGTAAELVLWGVVTTTMAILLIVVFTPALRSIFFFGPLNGIDLVVCAVAGAVAFTVLELVKWVSGKLGSRFG